MTFSEDETPRSRESQGTWRVRSSVMRPCTPKRRSAGPKKMHQEHEGRTSQYSTTGFAPLVSASVVQLTSDAGMDKLERKKRIHHSRHRPTSEDHDEADGEGEHRRAIPTGQGGQNHKSTCCVRLKALKIDPQQKNKEKMHWCAMKYGGAPYPTILQPPSHHRVLNHRGSQL